MSVTSMDLREAIDYVDKYGFDGDEINVAISLVLRAALASLNLSLVSEIIDGDL